MDTNIKEMIKFQMISKIGAPSGGQSDFKSMIMQFFMFIMMSLIDDITKSVSKFSQDTKIFISTFFRKKIEQNITIKTTPKLLADTSITLSTRHEISIITMTRVFKSQTESNNSTSVNDESNWIVDALIAHVSKLENIPNLSLITNGQLMMTYKDKPIQISAHIYLKIDSINIGATGEINSIKLSLLSNTLSSAELADFIKNLYANYQQEIKNSLGNKIYYFDQKSSTSTAPAMAPPNSDAAAIDNYKRMRISTAPKQLSFTMTPFYSNKKFSNIYGDEVRHIEKRINFFMNNKDWYDEKGIPYQIGLLLSGIPGAGKTSIIRALANMTKRHIVNVNFANITTASQLKNLFYSDKLQVYKDSSVSDTQSYFIPTDQRIYVLEELDAIGDIVKQRDDRDKNQSQNAINDELTLMEILTVLDGTMEIPGRIVIMTTNHPEVLDKALIRPGRIDIQTYFGYSKRELIVEMFEAYYDMPFPQELICKLPDKMLSPAEIGQILFKHFDNVNIDNIIEDLNETAIRLKRDTREALKDPLTSNTPEALKDPLTATTPEALKDPLTSNTPEALKEPLTATTPEALKDPLTSTQIQDALKKLEVNSKTFLGTDKITKQTQTQIVEMFEILFAQPFPPELIYKIPDKKLLASEVGEVFSKYILDPNIDNILNDLNKAAEGIFVEPAMLKKIIDPTEFNRQLNIQQIEDHGPANIVYEADLYPAFFEEDKNKKFSSSLFEKNKLDFVETTTTNALNKNVNYKRDKLKINESFYNIQPYNMTSDSVYEEFLP
jgi:AAA+ superfamily predicted ATPase